MNFRIFDILITLGEQIAKYINILWNWFTSDIRILGLRFTPLESLPYVGIALLVMYIINRFIH